MTDIVFVCNRPQSKLTHEHVHKCRTIDHRMEWCTKLATLVVTQTNNTTHNCNWTLRAKPQQTVHSHHMQHKELIGVVHSIEILL